MKTLGRILIIVAAFVLVLGITSLVVNSTSSSTTAPAFERGGEGLPQFPNSERPEFPGGERPEFRGAGPRGGGWMFGLVRNIGVIAIIVALLAVTKSFQRRKAVPVRDE
jgi:hypothetical protein